MRAAAMASKPRHITIAGWFVVVGGEVDGLDDGAEQVLGVQRLAGLRPAPGVP
jgi:hypothetical protein